MNEKIDNRDFSELSVNEARKRTADVLLHLAASFKQLGVTDRKKLTNLAEEMSSQ